MDWIKHTWRTHALLIHDPICQWSHQCSLGIQELTELDPALSHGRRQICVAFGGQLTGLARDLAPQIRFVFPEIGHICPQCVHLRLQQNKWVSVPKARWRIERFRVGVRGVALGRLVLPTFARVAVLGHELALVVLVLAFEVKVTIIGQGFFVTALFGFRCVSNPERIRNQNRISKIQRHKNIRAGVSTLPPLIKGICPLGTIDCGLSMVTFLLFGSGAPLESLFALDLAPTLLSRAVSLGPPSTSVVLVLVLALLP